MRPKGYAVTADHPGRGPDRTFWKSRIRATDPTYWGKGEEEEDRESSNRIYRSRKSRKPLKADRSRPSLATYKERTLHGDR